MFNEIEETASYSQAAIFFFYVYIFNPNASFSDPASFMLSEKLRRNALKLFLFWLQISENHTKCLLYKANRHPRI